MKKRVIKIAALVVLFAAVLVISNVILNRGNDDQVVDMGDATEIRHQFRYTRRHQDLHREHRWSQRECLCRLSWDRDL